MYVRTGSRMPTRVVGPRREVQQSTIAISSTAVGPGVSSFALDGGLAANLGGALELKGYRVKAIRLRLTAVPTIAPATAGKSTLFAGITMRNELLTNADLDPALNATRDQYAWLWYDNWPQPYTAAPVGATQILGMERVASLRRRRGRALRVYHTQADQLTLVFSELAAQTWSIVGHVRTWFELP